MEQAKKWYESSTIIGGLTALLAALLGFIMAMKPGLVLPEESEALTTNVPLVITSSVAIYGAIKAIIGRLKAKDEIK